MRRSVIQRTDSSRKVLCATPTWSFVPTAPASRQEMPLPMMGTPKDDRVVLLHPTARNCCAGHGQPFSTALALGAGLPRRRKRSPATGRPAASRWRPSARLGLAASATGLRAAGLRGRSELLPAVFRRSSAHLRQRSARHGKVGTAAVSDLCANSPARGLPVSGATMPRLTGQTASSSSMTSATGHASRKDGSSNINDR